jgi:CheY-like chemotaxis protein
VQTPVRHPANVLVVDDDPVYLFALRELLEDPARRLVLTASGAEALRWVLRHDFDLILLDVRMPDMDGFETAHLIRQRERSRRVPIVFVSAQGDRYAAQREDAGPTEYLCKPVAPEALRAIVARYTASSRPAPGTPA